MQGGNDISPFVEALMVIRKVTYATDVLRESSEEQGPGYERIEQSLSSPSFKPDMLVRAVFHRMSVLDSENEVVSERVYRIYDPHVLSDFHSRHSSLTLVGDTEVPTMICTQLMEVISI